MRSTHSRSGPRFSRRYRDLSRLRYDFPLVLVDRGPGTGTLRSLSSVVDEVLQEIAPKGLEGERLRKHVLRLEHEVRLLVAAGARGSLSDLWREATPRLAAPDDPSAEAVLTHLAEKLQLDGELVDCDRPMPARVVEHLWKAAQQQKARAFRATVERLVVRLSDILRSAFIHSEAGQRPDALRKALGGAHRDAFDFAVMSRLVARGAPKDELHAARRRRIEEALAVLKGQSFYPDPRLGGRHGRDTVLRVPLRQLRRRRGRVPRAAARGRRASSRRSPSPSSSPRAPMSSRSTTRSSRTSTSTRSPPRTSRSSPITSCALRPERAGAPENAPMMEMLSAGLPVKVLIEATDLLEEASVGTGHFAFGVRSVRLANTATALGGVFVVQTASSNLYALRERLGKAFAHRGACLVSIYAGAGAVGELPPYLTAAAAMESRAFPAFTYDPYAGDNQAARFALEDNPQPEADWPVAPFEYSDQDLQRMTEETPFTVADFVLCDARYASHFARVPRERWNDAMVPADEWLARASAESGEKIPYVLAVDGDDVLQRVIVDQQLMQIAGRCRTFWHRLQEQGGIHNSHAEILRCARAREMGAGEGGGAGAVAVRAAGRSRRGRRRRCGGPRGRGAPAAPTVPVEAAPRSRARSGRGMDRDGALPELQRVPEHQRQDVQVQREQAGLYRRRQAWHLSPDGRGGGVLPGRDHPSRQAVEPERAGIGRAGRPRRSVPLAANPRQAAMSKQADGRLAVRRG